MYVITVPKHYGQTDNMQSHNCTLRSTARYKNVS